MEPANSPVFSHNEIETTASAQNVWKVLVDAPHWHEFYSNCKGLKIMGAEKQLQLGSRFRWWTFGAPVETVVDRFEEGHYLAWTGKSLGSVGHHVWIIDKTPNGCRIITEETQKGLVVELLAPFLSRGLLYFHERWLEGLARTALA
ncbi:MAG: SRPBCC domain-containing protein [Candidatus Curtissbacteria bacterium]